VTTNSFFAEYRKNTWQKYLVLGKQPNSGSKYIYINFGRLEASTYLIRCTVFQEQRDVPYAIFWAYPRRSLMHIYTTTSSVGMSCTHVTKRNLPSATAYVRFSALGASSPCMWACMHHIWLKKTSKRHGRLLRAKKENIELFDS
jgi:hypothetical protein